MVFETETAVNIEGIIALWRDFERGASTSDAIHMTLREAIVHGFLPAGYRLAEVELASMLGVSRTPIREALHRLEMENLAVRIQRRGLEVRRVTLAEIQDAYDVYSQLVDMAVRLAASRVTSADAATLRSLNEQLEQALALHDLGRCVTLGDEFHRGLYRASGNDVLVRILGQLRYQTRSLASATFEDEQRASQIVTEHAFLIEALAAGDVMKSAEIAQLHNHNAMKARMRLFKLRNGT